MDEWGSETGVGSEIENRTAGTFTFVSGAPDHELEAGFPAGGRAHGTGLEGHVKGAVLEAPVADNPPRTSESYDLGMGCRIGIRLPLVSGASDDLAVAGNDCSDGNLFSPRSGLCDDQRLGHESAVLIRKNPLWEH
jgi:hypothetical protein